MKVRTKFIGRPRSYHRKKRISVFIPISQVEGDAVEFEVVQSVAKELAFGLLDELDLRPDARIIDLVERLESPGKPGDKLSASEFHELIDFINKLK